MASVENAQLRHADASFSLSSLRPSCLLLYMLQLPQRLGRRAIHRPSDVPETLQDECIILIRASRTEEFTIDMSTGKKYLRIYLSSNWITLPATQNFKVEINTCHYTCGIKKPHSCLTVSLQLMFPFCLRNTPFGVSWKIQK